MKMVVNGCYIYIHRMFMVSSEDNKEMRDDKIIWRRYMNMITATYILFMLCSVLILSHGMDTDTNSNTLHNKYINIIFHTLGIY